jgi:hypothetical protein
MFRALYENFQNESINELNQNIVRYQSVEPNLTVMNNQNDYPFPTTTGQPNSNAMAQYQQAVNVLGNVTNPTYGITTTVQPNLGSVFTGVPDTIGDKLKECRTYTGLAGLSNLIGQTNQSSEQRCAWRYKPGTGVVAEVAQGAFGTRAAPLDPARPQKDTVGNGVQYIWNLRDAEKQMVTDICKAATNCQDMGAVPVSAVGDFSNVCGYCKTSKKIIPIQRTGSEVRARYNTLDTQCAPSEIVTVNEAATKCPPPEPGQQEAAYTKCLKNGGLERDCVALSALFAGCNPNGTLLNALTTGTNPQDYADKLRLRKSFQVYQDLANPVLNEDVIRNGNATIFASFMNMYNLNQNQFRADQNKTSDQNLKIQIAAQDLCRQSGLYDSYNFCSDLTDQSRDYEVKCMQQEFLRAGGTVEGSAYPRTRPTTQISWGDYKRSIAELVKSTSSTNPNEQRESLNQLKGLGFQIIPSTLPRGEQSQGVETFWFRRNGGTFLGRRAVLSATGKNLPNFNVGGGIVEDVGSTDNVESVNIFDIRPQTGMKLRFGVVTDDGFTLALNQDPFAARDPSRLFSRMYDQGPTWHQSQCFDITSETGNRPNIVTWYWYENGGGAVFHPFYGDCTRNSWIEIAQQGRPLDTAWRDMCYFTQELDAPMLSFGAYQRNGQLFFQEKRMAQLFRSSNPPNTQYVRANNPMLPRDTLIMALDSRMWEMRRQIAFSSTHTLVLCFSLNEVDRERGMFSWMGGTNGVRLVTSVQSPTNFSVSLRCNANRTEYRTAPFSVKKDTWYIAAITLTTASKFTKKISGLKFFVQELRHLRDGNVLMGITEQAIQPNVVLFDEIKVNPAISGNLTLGNPGIKMKVGWLDFYDGTLPTSDTRLWKKAASRDWLGRWYE